METRSNQGPGANVTRRTVVRSALASVASLGAFGAAACGAGAGSGTGDVSSASSASSAAQKPVQGRVEFWGLNSPMLQTFVGEFNEQHPQAKAEYVPQSGWVQLFEKLYGAIAADTGPELVRVKEYNAIDLGAIKALEPLDSYIKADKSFKAEQFTPEQWKTANFGGAQYGVPYFNSIHVLLWNKTLF